MGPLLSDRAANVALAMRGVPYRYGGDTPRGFDCSGLVFYSYRREGIVLPRTAYGQSRLGRKVSRDDLRKGDLLFFEEGGHPWGHVGIYLGRGLFVHAPAFGQRVGISSLRNPYWSEHFTFARRLR
ncbi:MAG: C40 family peptidase [Acidiferrobacteraceae bacterium]